VRTDSAVSHRIEGASTTAQRNRDLTDNNLSASIVDKKNATKKHWIGALDWRIGLAHWTVPILRLPK
jgi:hypothetical protein